MDYLYDGSFEGLLTCVYEHYYQEKASGIYYKEEYQGSLICQSKTIITDEEKSKKVYDAIRKKISKEDQQRIYKVYKSSVIEKENKLLRYIVLGFKMGEMINSMHSNPIVLDVANAEKKINVEIHRLLGLARFSHEKMQNQDFLYCKLEPDHDVLEFITDHFAERLRNELIVIHDKIRKKAAIAHKGEWFITEFAIEESKIHEAEVVFRKLWKSYFETIAIEERKNPKCQKNFMPARYWKNLTELQNLNHHNLTELKNLNEPR